MKKGSSRRDPLRDNLQEAEGDEGKQSCAAWCAENKEQKWWLKK